MPTRFMLDIEMKGTITMDVLDNPTSKKECIEVGVYWLCFGLILVFSWRIRNSERSIWLERIPGFLRNCSFENKTEWDLVVEKYTNLKIY